MTTLLIWIHLLFSALLPGESGPDKVIACHYRDVPFTLFCQAIEKESGVHVYYRDEWVKDLRVTLDNPRITVLEAVRLALAGTGFEASAWQRHIVILPGVKLTSGLPEYRPEARQQDASQIKEKTVTASEERYLTGRKADAIQVIRIGKSNKALKSSRATVLGRIYDSETGEPLIGVTMYIEETKTGAVSDLNGYLSLVLKPGKYGAVVKYLGFEKQRYTLDVLSDGDFSISMKKPVIQIKEVVIYGDKQSNITLKDPGLDRISVKSIKEIPMLMGERDVLKVSQLMPGIVSVGEGSAGLNVRGGSSDQNAFYINKIPIYNTAHLFGFFPAFNADIIKDFSIYKGHIPARYGGRLSSVFNIMTRQGNRKRFTLHGGLSPIAGNLVAEGPLQKDSSSFILSARSTYSDWILGRIEDPLIRESSASFNDFTAGLSYERKRTRWQVFGYHSRDHFRLADINDYFYSNTGVSLIAGHHFSSSLRGEFSLVTSEYRFNTSDRQQATLAYSHAYAIKHHEARADFSHVTSYRNTLEYGLGGIWYGLDRGTVEPYGDESVRSPVTLGKEQGLETSLYLSDSYDMFPWLNLVFGIRGTLFAPLGEKTVYRYFPGNPLDVRYISDTLRYGPGKPVCWYGEPDIRAAVNVVTGRNGSLKLAFNQMHQNLFMLSNTLTIAPNTQWKLADYHIKPSRSRQLSLGVFRNLPNSGWETSVETFFKSTSRFPEFIDGADFLKNPLVETAVLQGEQSAYGVEFFLKRSRRKLDGWLSYTWSRSMIRVNGDHGWEKINEGEKYPANYDIPHVFNAVLNYHFNRRLTVSAVVAYQQGKPVTYPTAIYYIEGNPYMDYSKRNAYRIPDYFRTDLSLTMEGNLKRHKLIHSSLSLNLYNLTGRENPYSVYFVSEEGRLRSYQYSVIGVPIFTITWIFKLGNYETE